MNTTVTTKDLNAIDSANGSSSKTTKSTPIVNEDGETLKGALNDYKSKYGSKNWNIGDEFLYIESQREIIETYLTERFSYEGLPEGLNKYRLEGKLVRYGKACVLKINNIFYAMNFTVNDFDIYNEPVGITITEPKSKLMNNKKFNVLKDDIVIFRNNYKYNSQMELSLFYIKKMERILFQFMKNVTASAPKGLLNSKNGVIESDENGDNPHRDSLESIVNGENTFYNYRPSDDIDFKQLGDLNSESLFIPIELTDRSDSLMKQYFNIKEMLKEYVGSKITPNQAKMERLITNESEQPQGFPNSIKQQGYNVRKIAVDQMNEKFKLNIIFDIQKDTEGEGETDELNLQ